MGRFPSLLTLRGILGSTSVSFGNGQAGRTKWVSRVVPGASGFRPASEFSVSEVGGASGRGTSGMLGGFGSLRNCPR